MLFVFKDKSDSISGVAEKLMKFWLVDKWGKQWMLLFLIPSAIGLLLFCACMPMLIIVFLWNCNTGNPAPANLVLKIMFWVGITSAGCILTGHLFGIWLDLVRGRRGEKGKMITIQELYSENIDFERWCE